MTATEGLPDKRFLLCCNLPSSQYDYVTTGLVYYPGEFPGKDIHLPSYIVSKYEALRSLGPMQERGTDAVVIDLKKIPDYLILKENDYLLKDGPEGSGEKKYMLCGMTDGGIWAVDTLSAEFPHNFRTLVFAESYIHFHGNEDNIILDAGQILRFCKREKGKFVKRYEDEIREEKKSKGLILADTS